MIDKIFQFIQTYDRPIYAVGGCLRQKFLGLFVDDYDLIISHGAIELSKEIANIFHLNWIVLDRERDIARIFCQGITIDIAAYGKDLEQDLCLRDLSINAMACLVDLRLLQSGFTWQQKELIDPCNGLFDMQDKQIKGISVHNFESDPLRILRVFRFAAVLGFDIEKQTLDWAKSRANLLSQIASERILNELFKLLQASHTVSTLKTMYEAKISQQIFLDCSDLRNQNLVLIEVGLLERYFGEQKYVQIKAYLERFAADKRPYQFLLKLALLLWSGFESEKIGFEHLSQKIALSRHEIDVLQLWWREAKCLQELLNQPEDAKRWFHFFRRCGEHLLGLCVLGEVWLDSGRWQGNAELLSQMIDYWLDQYNQIAHPFELVNGKDVIAYSKIKPGPQIGEILLTIQEAQACGHISTREQAISHLMTFMPE